MFNIFKIDFKSHIYTLDVPIKGLSYSLKKWTKMLTKQHITHVVVYLFKNTCYVPGTALGAGGNSSEQNRQKSM